jgi:hypothetical protein
VSHHPIADPFRSITVSATLNGKPLTGFCDSQSGTVFRVRFMPTTSGTHHYTVTVGDQVFSGSFCATEAGNRGLLSAKEWGFFWSGTGKPFFWNATTCYLLAGLSEEKMRDALERLAGFGINRIRVSLCPSRQKDGGRWYEPQVGQREDFSYLYSPWLCRQPDSQEDPQPDTTRFDVGYWQKYERLLAHAQSLGIVVQVIFFTDAQEPYNYPFERPAPKPTGYIGDFDHSTRKPDANERLYYAYAAARLSAFSNVEWCITNEWALFQSNAWVDEMGAFLHSQDPYGHLCSVHGHGHFPFRTSSWCTHALFQSWDEHGSYDFLMRQRTEQEATGRIIPQVNEEYGYEDHYPGPWGGGRIAPARDARNRAHHAWEMVFAGCHQTTGESAASGQGGWINGLGDKEELLTYHQQMRSFFEAIPNWHTLQPTEPYVLENATYRVVYSPESGTATLKERE